MDGDGVWSRDMRLGEKRENEKDRTKLYEMDARNGREDAGVFSEKNYRGEKLRVRMGRRT